ncbi:unnamed protein product, partial [Laminaria digitata]
AGAGVEVGVKAGAEAWAAAPARLPPRFLRARRPKCRGVKTCWRRIRAKICWRRGTPRLSLPAQRTALLLRALPGQEVSPTLSGPRVRPAALLTERLSLSMMMVLRTRFWRRTPFLSSANAEKSAAAVIAAVVTVVTAALTAL